MSKNTVQFSLPESYVTPLFPFCPAGTTVEVCLELALNQSLQRDGFYGAWAQVYFVKPNVDIAITSPDPTADVTPYATVFPHWLAAVSTAVTAYNNVYATLNPKPPAPPNVNGVAFLAPFGLAMTQTRSVQLLHYPPTTTLSFMDYLYSETNRRWESLLSLNGSTGPQNLLLETITDLVPVAANGGGAGATAIGPFANAFGQYVPQMLNVFLKASPAGQSTQPVVGFGGPVMTFLQSTYKPIDVSPVPGRPSGKLSALSLFKQQIMSGGPTTPVLCTNHPSAFMYYPTSEKGFPPTDFKLVLQQDLTAARWQVQMGQNPDADPVATLGAAWAYWTSPDQAALFNTIFQAQVMEFTRPPWNFSPPAPAPAARPVAKPAAKSVASGKSKR